MKNLVLVSVVSLILLVGEISSHPANVINSAGVQDSNLERVHVKQETGFDGKVRSIRFNLERKDEKEVGDRDEDRVKASRGDNVPPEVVTSKLTSATSDADSSSSSRLTRSIDKESTGNTLDDLQAEEAKVFRPLFAYRQQVARRLKLKTDKKFGNSNPRVQRTNPINLNHYYHPYDYYQPYRHVPYNYYPRFRA